MSMTKKTVAAALNYYCFKNIWNEPILEYRHNIHPYKVKSRSMSGLCYLNTVPIPLPTSSPFFIYRFSKLHASGIGKLDDDTWYDTKTLCNDHNVLVHVYTNQGEMLPKDEVYIQMHGGCDIVTLAVTKRALKKISTSINLYVTIFRDSTVTGDVKVYTDYTTVRYHVLNGDHVQQILYLNGKNYPSDVGLSLYEDGDYIDLIVDEDIVGEAIIPVSASPNVFYSEVDELYKEILHIPDDIAPDRIVTFNTCSIFIRDVATDTGTYVHYTSDKTVSQITHHDLSIPRYIVDAHKDYLGVDNVYVVIKVRTFDKGNYAIRDASYTDLLYLDTDNILSHLKGDISEDLDFWKASELEKSEYVKMMFDVPNLITSNTADDYVMALGYYHAASIITKRIFTKYVEDPADRSYVFGKPFIWSNIDVYPVVYIKGIKIKASKITYMNNADGTISIKLDNSLYLQSGDSITVYYFPYGNHNTLSFEPTVAEHSYVINTNDFSLYEKTNGITLKGLYTETSYSYDQIDKDTDYFVTDNGDGTHTLTFHTSQYDKVFYLLYENTTRYFYKDLTDDVEEGNALVVNLNVPVTNDSGTNLPMLNVRDAAVYFNQKYLIENVGYKLVKVIDSDGNVGLTQVVITDMTYGNNDGPNSVEVIATTVGSDPGDHGFVANNVISKDLDIDIYFEGLSAVHVNGKYTNEVTPTGFGLVLPEGEYDNGSIFELKNSIPTEVVELLLPALPALDIEKIRIIEEYFTSIEDPSTDLVVVPDTYTIYSPYLTFIIRGIVDDTIQISYDPIIANIQAQLVNYQYLRKFDPIFDDPFDLNLKYIDISPSYKEIIADTSKHQLIRAIANLILPTDDTQLGVSNNE